MLTEEFTIPAVGSEGFMRVCDGNRWKRAQWVAAHAGGNNIAGLRVTAVYGNKIKVLNGLSASSTDPIIGNPAPGKVLAAGTLIYPMTPPGSQGTIARC